MGCIASSSPRTAPKQTNSASTERPSFSKLRASNFMQEGSAIDSKYKNQNLIFSNAFNSITSDVHTVRCPSGMVPPVCLSSCSFPIILSQLELNDSEPTDISLPVLSLSCNNDFKIACLSHVQFLSSICFDFEDTSIFINNIIQWLNHDELLSKPILLYGFTERFRFEACHSLDKSNILFKTANSPSYHKCNKSKSLFRKNSQINFNNRENLDNFLNDETYDDNIISIENHEVILCSTSSDIMQPSIRQKFVSFLKNGGGILFLYTPDSPNKVNKFLLDYGLSYSNCTLSTNGKSRISIDLQPNLDYLLPCHFLSYSKLYCEYLKFPKLNPGELDDIITALRYHIMVCDERHLNTIFEIARSSWDYLISTNYKTENGIAPQIQQSIIIVLLDKIIQKTPPEKIKPIEDYKSFPGSFNNSNPLNSSSKNLISNNYSLEKVEVSNFNLDIILHSDSWISTGLYLPPGVIGIIKCENFTKNMHVQIGSHTEPLILKQGPWKRWPDIVSTFDISQKEIKVASCFGGIVYIYISHDEDYEEEEGNENEILDEKVEQGFDTDQINSQNEEINETSLKVRMSFENFTHYPRIVFENSAIYEKTKNSGAPWGELCSNSLIITMLSSEMKKIEKPDELCSFLDKTVTMMSTLICYKIVRPYRLVFDVEKVDEEITGDYPAVLLLGMQNDIIFNYKTPTIAFFCMVKSLAIVSLPENHFDAYTEAALGSVIATIIFKSNWPEFDTSCLPNYIKMPPLFNELWKIHSRFNNQILLNMIENAQKQDAVTYNSSEEMWTAFIRELCQIANCNLTPLIEKVRPIPISLLETISKLPKCPERILK